MDNINQIQPTPESQERDAAQGGGLNGENEVNSEIKSGNVGSKNAGGNAEGKELETRERAEIAISEIENHRAGLYLAERYLPKERVENISRELAEIDELENTRTVEMRKELGTLPEDFSKTENALVMRGINPGRLTVEEAKSLYDYTSNATDEAIDRKTRTIAGAIARVRNGVKHRRDWYWDAEKADRLDYLTEKYERFERGQVDTELGYDKDFILNGYDGNGNHGRAGADRYDNKEFYGDRYVPGMWEEPETGESYDNDDYARFFRDMGVETPLERAMEDMDAEELLENDLISEEDLFVYGPFTGRDLEGDYQIFRHSSWVDAQNFRNKNNTADLLQDTVNPRERDLELDLVRSYVADEFLPDRRPSAKNMLSMVASLGMEYTKRTKAEIEDAMTEKQAKELKDNIGYAAYYAVRAMDMRLDDVRADYGTQRPVKYEFFEELLKRSENLTETQEKWIEKNVAPFLTKLNDRLNAAEAIYELVLSKDNAEEGGSDFEGLALPDFGSNLIQAADNLDSLK